MCSRYAEAQCCVCHRYLGQSNNRIIVEICGHRKCRECFIKEEDGCSLCVQNESPGSEDVQSHASNFLSVASSSGDGKDDGEGAEPPDVSTIGDITEDASGELTEDASHIITTNNSGDEVRYKCNICQKSFKSRNNRKYHLFCDKTRSKPFQCNQCDKQFITLAHMNYHQSTHNTDKRYSCPHCQKVYSGDIALKKHMRKHQNDFKYQCSQCEEKFLYKEQLNIHQNRHNNVFHKCPECGKRFLVKSNLTKHIQSHSGVNRKTCSVCKNSFSGNSALKTHMLTHSKSKPHQCQKCSKKFIDQRTLERHWKTHSDNQFYECTLCSAKSGRKDNIRRHVRNLHSESDEELRSILAKIFDNFEKKKNELSEKSIDAREKKTDKSHAIQTAKTAVTNEGNNSNEDAIKSTGVVRNIATSVIKFVGRSQDIQLAHKEAEKTSPSPIQIIISDSDKSERFEGDKFAPWKKRRQIESKPYAVTNESAGVVDSIAEIGVNLPSLEPLNFDPFPDIAPLPLLNTNTNLTVYRQLLSPYLKKPPDLSNDSSNAPVQPQISPNKHLRSGSTTSMVIDRPPKKMIEKYEIYRN